MAILVTGGAGYIGSHIVKQLIGGGYEVIIIDKKKPMEIFSNIVSYQGDLADEFLLNNIFKSHKIDCVIHLAAFIEAGESMINPAKFFKNNLSNTINLLQVMLNFDVKKIIFSSTAAVYGEPEKELIDEKHPLKPTNYYGDTKLMIEKILEIYQKAYGLRYIALRYFNAAGADESGLIGEDHDPETHLIPLILKTALGKRDKIYIFGDDYETKDGTCIRDYIHVNDLAKAHILAMEKINDLSGPFNLGNGQGFSVKEIIDLSKNVTGINFNVKKSTRREGDPAILVADYRKAKEILGWEPKYSIKEIIQSAWKWEQRKIS